MVRDSAVRRFARIWQLLAMVLLLVSSLYSPLFALPVNSTAPDFTLTSTEGKSVSLRDYRGKGVILKLGTTWCPGCRDQDSELQKIDALIAKGGIALIEVFLDDPVEAVKSYQRDYAMKSPVVTLLGNEKIMRDYGVYAIPRLIILTPELKVLQDSTGLTAAQIKAQILLMNSRSIK